IVGGRQLDRDHIEEGIHGEGVVLRGRHEEVHENSRRVRTDPTGPPLEYTTWKTVTGYAIIGVLFFGKGRSYGALAIGCANKLFMLENITFYVAIYHFVAIFI
ncbi:hypothetical protein Tco_1287201, partial [Tanacetum coccineum]